MNRIFIIAGEVSGDTHAAGLRHGDGDVLVRHGDGLGHLHAVRGGLGIGFDQRREIGARIGEQIVDAAVGQKREIGVGHGARRDGFGRHEKLRFRI